jgi:hypothetical protein
MVVKGAKLTSAHKLLDSAESVLFENVPQGHGRVRKSMDTRRIESSRTGRVVKAAELPRTTPSRALASQNVR